MSLSSSTTGWRRTVGGKRAIIPRAGGGSGGAGTQRAQVLAQLRGLVDVEVAAEQEQPARQPVQGVGMGMEAAGLLVDRLQLAGAVAQPCSASSIGACRVTTAR